MIRPYKTDTPLIVYPDTVLALAFTFQGFEAIGRGNAQIINVFCVVQHTQFPTCNSLNIIGQPTRPAALPDPLGFPILEIFDHFRTITLRNI
jgi:hypothetical protein